MTPLTWAIKWIDYSSKDLNARIDEPRRRDQPFAWDPIHIAIRNPTRFKL